MSDKSQYDEQLYTSSRQLSVSKYQEVIWRIRQARRAKGWTQKDLANKLDLHQSQVSDIERMKNTNASFMLILVMASAVGVEFKVSDSS